MFSALKLSQNCLIMHIIRFPTNHIYLAWKAILTIWQNVKARKLQKSQFPNFLVNWGILGSTKLMFKNTHFQSLPWIGKNWQVQLGQHSKLPVIDLFVNWENVEVQHKTKIPKSKFWIYWCIGKSYVLI